MAEKPKDLTPNEFPKIVWEPGKLAEPLEQLFARQFKGGYHLTAAVWRYSSERSGLAARLVAGGSYSDDRSLAKGIRHLTGQIGQNPDER